MTTGGDNASEERCIPPPIGDKISCRRADRNHRGNRLGVIAPPHPSLTRNDDNQHAFPDDD